MTKHFSLSILIISLFFVLGSWIMPGQTLSLAEPLANATPIGDSVSLDSVKRSDIGFMYEAYLSPQQEPAEEEDTPRIAPENFRSTEPSVNREQRPSHGYGAVRITNDLSKAYVHVDVAGVNPDDIVLFHLHCGAPDLLGPILVDFSMDGNFQENFADLNFETMVTNQDIEKLADEGSGLVGAYTAGCPIVPTNPAAGKVKTIAGLQHIAEKGELYFNLHTKAQTFYGEIRGKLHPVLFR